MVDYSGFGGNGGNSGGNSGDDFDTVNVKITPYATIDGTLEKVFPSGSSYGQSLVTVLRDAELVDGAIYLRTHIGEEEDTSGTMKVFGWSALGYQDGMDFTAEDAPRINSETFGGKTYSYELVAARTDDHEPDSDTYKIGDIIIFDGANQQYGPNSASKTAARTLTNLGRAAVIDENDYKNWLDTGIELREDLEGMRIRHYRIRADGENNKFTRPIYINAKIGEPITIGKATTAVATATDGGAAVVEEEPSAEPESSGDFVAPVQEFVKFCRDENITDETSILAVMDTSVGNDATDLTAEMVDGNRDAIVDAIQQ